MPDRVQVSVSNENAEIVKCGTLSDQDVSIKTTILLDISSSIPAEMRDRVVEATKKFIEAKPANEEIRIYSFGENLRLIQDFTADRYDLILSLESITFDDIESKIYEAIYSTIPVLSLVEDKPTFFRTIILTDGVDDTASGVTKEELFVKLQNQFYPIDVVAIDRSKTAENKELAAIVRISGGRYHSLYPEVILNVLVQSLSVNKLSYVEATLPLSLLDGSIRQVDVSDGSVHLSADVKFSVHNKFSPVTDPEEIAPLTPTYTAPANPDLTAKPSIFSTKSPLVFIAIGLGVVGLISVIIIILRTRKKKKKAPEPYSDFTHVVPEEKEPYYNDKTEFLGETDFSGAQYTIKLSQLNSPGQVWTLPVKDSLIIGRLAHCHVRFSDMSVSREQCKISVHSSGLIVTHLGKTNKTMLNGAIVSDSAPLLSGDQIKFGRETLRVDYIQAVGNQPSTERKAEDNRSGRTESIF